MSRMLTFFEVSGQRDRLVPLADAASDWGGGTSMRGMAVSAALARQALVTLGDDGFDELRPGRWTVDLSRPASMDECRTRGRVLRRGRRLVLVETELVQRDDVVAARGRGVFLSPCPPARGVAWEDSSEMPVPPAELVPLPDHLRLFWSEHQGWAVDQAALLNTERKALWQFPFEVVRDEGLNAFEFAAGVADLASVVTQWSDAGQQHINVDMSLHLLRPPERLQSGLGVAALFRGHDGGQAVGTAVLHDLTGPVGTSAVTTLQNEAASVDPHHRRRRVAD